MAPSANVPPEIDPAGVPPLVPLVVWFDVPVNVCAAAVRLFTVSAGTVVVEPVNVCAAAVRLLIVSAGTVVLAPVNACAAAVSVPTLADPNGVMVDEPPVVPTPPTAAVVSRT
jgi:hypothetical protein